MGKYEDLSEKWGHIFEIQQKSKMVASGHMTF